MSTNYEKLFSDYYLTQAQGGEGFANIYAGPSFQSGNGIGSFLGGLFRTVWPIFRTGAYSVGKESLKTAANILSDVSNEHNLKQSFKNRSKEGVSNLKQKFINTMKGNGPFHLCHTRKRKLEQSTSPQKNKNKKKNKLNKSKNKRECTSDIFKA